MLRYVSKGYKIRGVAACLAVRTLLRPAPVTPVRIVSASRELWGQAWEALMAAEGRSPNRN